MTSQSTHIAEQKCTDVCKKCIELPHNNEQKCSGGNLYICIDCNQIYCEYCCSRNDIMCTRQTLCNIIPYSIPRRGISCGFGNSIGMSIIKNDSNANIMEYRVIIDYNDEYLEKIFTYKNGRVIKLVDVDGSTMSTEIQQSIFYIINIPFIAETLGFGKSDEFYIGCDKCHNKINDFEYNACVNPNCEYDAHNSCDVKQCPKCNEPLNVRANLYHHPDI